MKRTSFDRYLDEHLKDPAFAARSELAGEACDVMLQTAALRKEAGLSPRDLARLLKISQQQISRLESPGNQGHSLSTLRRVAEVLHAQVASPSNRRNKGPACAWRRPLRDMARVEESCRVGRYPKHGNTADRIII